MMKNKSVKRKRTKRVGGSPPTNAKIPKTQYQEPSPPKTANHAESLVSNSPLPGHFYNYNDIVHQLIQRKAHYLSPKEKNSSYEEWARSQDQIALAQASSSAIEDVLKARIKLTKDKFIDNLNWRTLDIVNYLVSTHAEAAPSPLSTDSGRREDSMYAQRNPLVLTASVKKKTKAGVNDQSKTARKSNTPKKSYTSLKPSTPLSADKVKEPTFPKKYQPTYKLSNYDYVKRGWTKLPDYSITYKYYTLGTEPAFPALWAFRERTQGRKDLYPNTNKVAADFEGEKPPYIVYHPNGEIAISINDGRVGPRLIVYSMSKKDESGRWIESRPQAMFDSKGNGVVYDIDGEMRMNYDQIEGAVYKFGKKSRPALHWYWKESTFLRMRREDLNIVPPDHNDDIDPNKPDGGSPKSRSRGERGKKRSHKRKSRTPKSKGRKSKVGGRKSKVARKSVTRKSVTRKSVSSRKSRISSKSKGSVKSARTRKSETPRKSGTGKKGKSGRRKSMKKGGGGKRATRIDIPPLRKKPRHPKPITEVAPLALKITDHVSMRIMNQQHIHLDFECGAVHYRLYLGVNVKPEIVERIDKVVNPKRVDNVAPCYFELMPLRSMSLYNVNKKIQEMKKQAAKRKYNQNIKTIGGFYSWWLKKKRQAFEKKREHQLLMPMSLPSIKIR